MYSLLYYIICQYTVATGFMYEKPSITDYCDICLSIKIVSLVSYSVIYDL